MKLPATNSSKSAVPMRQRLASRARGTMQLSRRRIVMGIADAVQREQLADGIGDLGCDIEAVGDGLHVIERLAGALEHDDGRRPCLVVLDALLPGITGISVLAGLRDLHWDIPVIILAAHDDAMSEERARRAGATHVFVTPLSVEELHESIERELGPRVSKTASMLIPRRGRRTRPPLGTRHSRKHRSSSTSRALPGVVNSNA